MRHSILLLSLVPGLLMAQPWRTQTGAEVKAMSLDIQSSNPDLLNVQQGRTGLLAVQQWFQETPGHDARYRLLGQIDSSLSSQESFQTLRLDSQQRWQIQEHGLSLGFIFLEKRGRDLREAPLELALIQNPEAFRSASADLLYQYGLSPTATLVSELIVSRNTQRPSALNTAELRLSYLTRPLPNWATGWSLRLGEQDGTAITDYSFRELSHSQWYAWSPQWSLEGTLGLGEQSLAQERQGSTLALVALNFSSRQTNPEEPSLAPRLRRPLDIGELAEEAALRGEDRARLSWSRNLAQKRLGDPYFTAQTWTLSWAASPAVDQGLEFAAEALRSDNPRTAAEDFVQKRISGTYAWTYLLGSAPAAPRGGLSLELAVERTESPQETLRRRLATLQYLLIF